MLPLIKRERPVLGMFPHLILNLPAEVMQSGLTVLKIKMSGGGASQQSSTGTQKKSLKTSLPKKYTSKGEAVGLEFLKRLLELHGSGMPVADAVKLLNHRLSDPQQKSLSGVLWKELAEGRTLSRAMRLLPGVANHPPA